MLLIKLLTRFDALVAMGALVLFVATLLLFFKVAPAEKGNNALKLLFYFLLACEAILFIYALLFGFGVDKNTVNIGNNEGTETSDDSVLQKGTLSDTVAWVLYDDGVLEVNGSGDIVIDELYYEEWKAVLKKSKTVIIGEGIETIGDVAFASDSLKAVRLPFTLKKIGYSAFRTSRLVSVTIPDSVQTIGSYCFASCESLETVVFKGGCSFIGKNAFLSCDVVFDVGENTYLRDYAAKEGFEYIYSGKDSAADSACEEIGNPFNSYYDDERSAGRNIYDLAVYDGKLFVGGGDYTANLSPVPIYCYDEEKREWMTESEGLPEEAIRRFYIIDGKLIITGTDPTQSWEWGNYYVRGDDGTWFKNRVLPGAVHAFDIVSYQGTLFVGIGCNAGEYPVVKMTSDGNFEHVTFMRGDIAVDTTASERIRVYNIFEMNTALYAVAYIDAEIAIYKYDSEKNVFEFYITPSDYTDIIGANTDLASIVSFNDCVIISDGAYCYKTKDFKKFELIALNGYTSYITDVYIDSDSVCFLSYTYINAGQKKYSVWKTDDLGSFTEIVSFMSSETLDTLAVGEYGVYVAERFPFSDPKGESSEKSKIYSVLFKS